MTLVQVEGRTVSVVARPGAGPCVAFDAGLGGWSAFWRLVLDALPGVACIAWDRPGLGLSAPDPGVPTADRVAAQWREALRAAGHESPYVLVGHSLGGHHVRAFAGQWPEEVAGLVLVDVSIASLPVGPVRRTLSRLLSSGSAGSAALVDLLPEDERVAAREVLASSSYTAAVARERELVAVKAEALAWPLPAVPGEVLSGSGAELARLPGLARRVLRLDRVIARIQRTHQELAASVPGGAWSVVPGSTHLIPLDDPGAVAAAVRRVLTAAAVAR